MTADAFEYPPHCRLPRRQIHSATALATQIMLTMGLAAMGLQADISELRSRGLRPLMLAFSAFLFIAGFSLVLVRFV